jgi:hypothetical protein
MEKEFITYEQALALKELEFDEPCIAFYYNKTKFLKLGDNPNYLINKRKASYVFGNEKYDVTLAPLYQQAFRWFREKYDLWSCIQKYPTLENPNRCYYELKGNNINTDKNESPNSYMSGWFDSYEKAELNCLKKLIEIIKEKQ